jgi:aspartyl-tRNA(Asn)/glutamyl-tRNA(Gln) amidotransferase subunit A
VSSILETAAALRTRALSSAEITEACLNRIGQLNPRLNAFITVTAAEARAQARMRDEELAAGRHRGPLHGIPIALKDMFETRGIRTTFGSKVFEDYVPDHDAAVVERLQAAGAVLVGKTGMHELAYGITSNNPWFGAVRNPWDTDRIPGGSSGGSGAAVACGMAFMAMGSDTGGSIRIPSSFCGTAGLKPTFGRVSCFGTLPVDFSLGHMGPLAATVRDTAVTLDAIAGHDPRDPGTSRVPVPDSYVPPPGVSIKGMRIGLPENFFFDNVTPEVNAAVRHMAAVAETLGASVHTVRVPDFLAINAVARVILLTEASAIWESRMSRRDQFGADVLALLDQGRLLPATDYINAQRLRRLLTAEFSQIWKSVDVLLAPATPMPAPRIGQTTVEFNGLTEDTRLASTRFARGFNLLGVPMLSMPCGFSADDGLPLGMQIAAPPFAEERLLRVGAALEDATEYHLRRPQL